MAKRISGTYGKFEYWVEVDDDVEITDELEIAIEDGAVDRISYIASEGYLSGELNGCYCDNDDNEIEYSGWVV